MEIKLVSISLAVHFLHNVLIIIISESSAHLVIVHVWFRLPLSPFPGNLIRVSQLELPGGPLPGDEGGVGGVRQKLQEELPELYLSRGLR